MNDKDSFFTKSNIMQFIKFAIVGITNTIIAFGVYYLLYFLGVHYMISIFFGWVLGVFNGFYWNNKYVFQTDDGWWRILFKTYISYGISFLAGTVLLFLLVEYMQVSPVVAPIICLLITVPLNFLLNKFWAFK